FPPFIGQIFEVRARIVLAFYLLLDNVLPFLVQHDGTGVAHGAHIGGFLAGMALAWVSDLRATRGRRDVYATTAAAAPAVSIGDTIDAGRYAEAASAYFALSASATVRVLAPHQALALAAWLRRNRYVDAASTLLRRVLRDVPSGAGRAAAHVALGELMLDD